MNLGDGGWRLSNVRVSNVSGYKGDYRSRKLQNYLRNNKITAYSNDATSLKSYASIPVAGGNCKYCRCFCKLEFHI